MKIAVKTALHVVRVLALAATNNVVAVAAANKLNSLKRKTKTLQIPLKMRPMREPMGKLKHAQQLRAKALQI